MTGRDGRDPIARWTELSARAADATTAPRPIAEHRGGDAAPVMTPVSVGALLLAAVVVVVALTGRPTAVAPASSAPSAVIDPTQTPGLPTRAPTDPAVAGPSVAASDGPTLEGPATSSIADELFDLALTAPRRWYTPAEAIEPFAVVRYLGPDETVTVGHSDPYLTFTIEQLDGDWQMTGGAADSCTVTTFTRETAVAIPFHKAGQGGLGFDEAWFREPALRLPVGTWRITARFEGGIPACEGGGEQHVLSTSIDVTVVAAP